VTGYPAAMDMWVETGSFCARVGHPRRFRHTRNKGV